MMEIIASRYNAINRSLAARSPRELLQAAASLLLESAQPFAHGVTAAAKGARGVADAVLFGVDNQAQHNSMLLIAPSPRSYHARSP